MHTPHILHQRKATHILAPCSEGKGQLRSKGTLPHSSLARQHQDFVLDGRHAGRNCFSIWIWALGCGCADRLVGASCAGWRRACLLALSANALCTTSAIHMSQQDTRGREIGQLSRQHTIARKSEEVEGNHLDSQCELWRGTAAGSAFRQQQVLCMCCEVSW